MPPAMSLVHNLSRLSLLPSVRVRLLHQIFRWIKHWKRAMGDSKETEMLAE
ncbi:hypothetical protein RAB80_018375 [Fusarium oxysporum f. sp. vasinfectum]|jgi:hypothetical protein|nr:hypothetical protein RAB80_018375 [Fusarium oxysporum f. sp. vasinfectum]